jgi:hypothetical protein
VAAKEGPRDEVKHDTGPPLRTIPPQHRDRGKKIRPEHRFVHTASPTVADPAVQEVAPTGAALTPGVGFQGMQAVDAMPPDPNAAVGPNNIVEVVNRTFAVYSKSGGVQYGPADTSTLWAGFDPSGPGHACETENDGDATVAYDRAANRFVLQQFSLEPYFGGTGEYLECVAVSATGNPTGAWHRYAFGGFGGVDGNFPDYPKLGVWPDGYYTTYNLFVGTFFSYVGPEVCAYERAKMLAGQAAQQQCKTVDNLDLNGFLPSDVDSSTPPPAGSPNYLLGLLVPSGGGSPSIRMFKFHVDWANANNTTFTGDSNPNGVKVNNVPAFTLGCGGANCIKQPSGGAKLDSLGDRLMYRLAYRNFGDHESLVVTHTVTAGSFTGVRWYELRNPNAATPAMFQSGTFAPSDSRFRWMGSAAQDKDGDIALGYSLSGADIKPSIAATGRLAEDPLNTLTQGETQLKKGNGLQISTIDCDNFDCSLRWGDYTSMQIDPSDDCTFWYTNQFQPSNGNFNWSTWIASFKLPNCGGGGGPPGNDDFSISAAPASLSVARGATGKTIISTAVTGGSAQPITLTATGVPAKVKPTFVTNPVTAGLTSKLKFAVGTGAVKGTYSITVTGAEAGGATHSTTVSLKVT